MLRGIDLDFLTERISKKRIMYAWILKDSMLTFRLHSSIKQARNIASIDHSRVPVEIEQRFDQRTKQIRFLCCTQRKLFLKSK